MPGSGKIEILKKRRLNPSAVDHAGRWAGSNHVAGHPPVIGCDGHLWTSLSEASWEIGREPPGQAGQAADSASIYGMDDALRVVNDG
jgi:hypothetical protein